jgi:hypothetical protein
MFSFSANFRHHRSVIPGMNVRMLPTRLNTRGGDGRSAFLLSRLLRLASLLPPRRPARLLAAVAGSLNTVMSSVLRWQLHRSTQHPG